MHDVIKQYLAETKHSSGVLITREGSRYIIAWGGVDDVPECIHDADSYEEALETFSRWFHARGEKLN